MFRTIKHRQSSPEYFVNIKDLWKTYADSGSYVCSFISRQGAGAFVLQGDELQSDFWISDLVEGELQGLLRHIGVEIAPDSPLLRLSRIKKTRIKIRFWSASAEASECSPACPSSPWRCRCCRPTRPASTGTCGGWPPRRTSAGTPWHCSPHPTEQKPGRTQPAAPREPWQATCWLLPLAPSRHKHTKWLWEGATRRSVIQLQSPSPLPWPLDSRAVSEGVSKFSFTDRTSVSRLHISAESAFQSVWHRDVWNRHRISMESCTSSYVRVVCFLSAFQRQNTKWNEEQAVMSKKAGWSICTWIIWTFFTYMKNTLNNSWKL